MAGTHERPDGGTEWRVLKASGEWEFSHDKILAMILRSGDANGRRLNRCR